MSLYPCFQIWQCSIEETHTCFGCSFRAPESVSAPWMRWLCKPGAEGDDPDDPEQTQEHCSHRLVWHEGDEVSELEVRRRKTKANKKERKRERGKGMMTCWVVVWLLAALWLIESGMLSFPLLLFVHVPIADSCIITADKQHQQQQATAKRNLNKQKKRTRKTSAGESTGQNQSKGDNLKDRNISLHFIDPFLKQSFSTHRKTELNRL